jgi:hypothetical protein
MPIRGQNSAPKFEGTAPSLNRFFSDFEYLANISQLTKAQKKRDIVRYLSTEDADFWTQQPQWADASATWNDFKNTIRKAYPGSEPTERNRISDMDALVSATQRISIRDLTEFSDFYHKFCTIVEYLSSQNRIGDREISMNFLCALLADLQHKIMFHIQVSDPNQHVDDPHTEIAVQCRCPHPQRKRHPGHNESLRCCRRICATTESSSSTTPSSTAVTGQLPTEHVHPQHINIVALQLLPAAGTTGTIPYHQQTVLVQPPAPATPQPNTYQPLPYTLGLKQEDIMTIAMTIALAFAKQLTPLFQ